MVQGRKLVIHREKISLLHAKILSKYLYWSIENPNYNIRVLDIQSCGLGDEILAELLSGIAQQNKITSITIADEEIGPKSMEQLDKILVREPPRALLELNLIKVKGLTIATVRALFTSLYSSNLAKLTLKDFVLLQSREDSSEIIDYLC